MADAAVFGKTFNEAAQGVINIKGGVPGGGQQAVPHLKADIGKGPVQAS